MVASHLAHSENRLDDVRGEIQVLLSDLEHAEATWQSWIKVVATEHRRSAQNIAHYWALRQHDLRRLQDSLTALGLSSLGRSEAHVQHTLRLVEAAVAALRGERHEPPKDATVDIASADERLQRNTDLLLGAEPGNRGTRIMVTLPSDAADDRELLDGFIDAEMDIARINCAKDDAPAWRKMAQNVRAAADSAGRRCSIAMDLAGPKLRTGPLGSEDALLLGGGDILHLVRDTAPNPTDADPLRIGCTLPEVFDCAEAGQRVYFDDGKLGGEIESVEDGHIAVRITHPAHDTAKLKPGKGIDVPDTDLPVSAITDDDIESLRTVVEIADIVQMSFVRNADDVRRLLDQLDDLGAVDIGLVLKIETKPAFENLPQIVMSAMARRKVGVMIARGDLAVEVGYERMAEIQEEILWLCEAAHLPVVWATQVFEQLAKTGEPARAEVSDAALSGRAECVMLNKGPYITDALRSLDSILRRMSEHTYKKRPLLRVLTSWQPDN